MAKHKHRLIVSKRFAEDKLVEKVADRMLKSLQATPLEKADKPSVFAIPTGFNTTMGNSNKRMTSSQVEPFILRQLSIQHETTRAAINARKRQITQLDFDIVDIQNDMKPMGTAPEQEAARQQLLAIGGPGVRFRQLLDKMIEDLLVLDAIAVYKQRTRGGQLLRLVPIDGATIKLRVDEAGMRPMPPEIAFEQWLAGKKVADLTTDELLYEMMNPRNDSPYGLSPIESLIISLDASMRALLYNLNYLSDNNLPMGFLQMPDGWTIAQLKEYKEWFDAMVSGSKQTAKLYPIPSSTTYQPVSKPTDFAFADFFEYLDRKVCMLFDIQPQELGLSLKQYKENAEGQDKIQIRKGIRPLANFLEEIFTDILRNELGYPRFAFKFVGLDGRYTTEELKALVPIGIIGVDEARNDRGLAKIGVGNLIIAGQQITPIGNNNTTISGMTVSEEQEDNAPDLPSKEKLQKMAQDVPLDELQKKKKFSEFKGRVQDALIRQIEPFTQQSTIDKVTSAKKADFQGIVEDNVDQEAPSLQIFFDNDSINQFLLWASQQGSDRASAQLGVATSFTFTSAMFKKFLADRANYLIKSVDATTKDWIINQILDGKDLNMTNADIAQKIADGVESISLTRAEMIVNTEVANAVGAGQVAIYQQQGIEEKEWVTSEDNKVCPICEPLDGEVVKVDEDFSIGVDHEPAHPNCRCYTQAVLTPLN